MSQRIRDRFGRRVRAGLCASLLALLPGAVLSAEAVRCGNRLISRGDHAAKVLHHCGEPDAIRTRVAVRGFFSAGGLLLPGFAEEVEIEEWTYNLGPHKLMRTLYLENGVVRDVETLGYGYRD